MERPGPHLLLAESTGLSDEALSLLRSVARVRALDLDRSGLLAELGGTEILWVRLRTKVDREVMDAGRALRLVVSPTTGLNHIDLEEAAKRGIKVLSLQGETEFLRTIHATAELTVGLILALLRRIPAASRHVTEGGWSRDLFRGSELHGRSIGIVGYGRLGSLVAPIVRSFGAAVTATDPLRTPGTEADGVRFQSLESLLASSDIVSLHASWSEANRSFFGRREFSLMRRGSWFVNTARGELVEEPALVEALVSGHLAGAALDVLTDETSAAVADHPLVRLARAGGNVVITPHIGGATRESMEATELFLARKLVAHLSSGAAFKEQG